MPGVSKYERGDLESWGGIVSGRLASYADALGCPPAAVLDAIDRAGAEVLVDTAEPKNQEAEGSRPEAPELRCLAMTAEAFAAVRAATRQAGDAARVATA
jgi:hypothetical protein